ncbi:MAG: GDSL-type esterase/lipase family protein [Microthrixaceae bacterium]
MQRGIALGVPAFTVAVGAGLCHEFYRVAHAPLPRFEDNDPSGVYGSGDGPPVRVDVLGDSSVTAPGLDHGQLSWVALACDSMNARVELRSRARGGSRVADVLESQIDGVLEDPPEVAIVSVGANDVLHGTPARSYRRDLVECLDSLRSVCDVVTLGVGDLSVIPRLSYTLRLLVARRSATFDRLHEDICSISGAPPGCRSESLPILLRRRPTGTLHRRSVPPQRGGPQDLGSLFRTESSSSSRGTRIVCPEPWGRAHVVSFNGFS